MRMILVKVLGIVIFSALVFGADVEEIYTWNYVEYEDLPKPENSYVTPDEPYYIPGNTNVEGIAYQASTGLFLVTVARARRGVPSTVNYFCASDYRKGSNTPRVRGFPNYEINELKAEYFSTEKRSIRSVDGEMKKEVVMAEEEKVVGQEFEVKSDITIENRQPENTQKEEVVKSNDENESKLDGKSNTKKDQQVDEEVDDDTQRKGSFGNKHGSWSSGHKDKETTNHGSNYDYHTKPTHGSYTYKPQYTTSKPHAWHTKPSYQHVTTEKPHYSKPHNKPNYSHNYYTKPHKNKYNSLSQIHTVHTDYSSTKKNVVYLPLPYKEPFQKPEESVQPHENFVSVYHPVIDDVCNRVWLLDTGALNYQEGDIEIQLASLWIIDLPRVACGEGPYSIRRRFEIPKSVVADGGGLSSTALDYKKGGTCEDVFVYFSNIFTGKMNVYDYKNNKAWSFQDHFSFFPVISTSTYTLDGEEFVEEMGVFSVTLGWRDSRGFRTAYYISPTTTVQFGVSTEILQQEQLAPTNYNTNDFHPIGNRGYGTQAVVHVFDAKNGVIFYGDRNGLSLRCWNVRQPPTPDYIDVVYQDENFVFIHEIFIDEQGFLYALSNRNPFYFKYGFDTSKVNVRLYRVHVDDAIQGTLCANDEYEYRAQGIFDYPKANETFIV